MKIKDWVDSVRPSAQKVSGFGFYQKNFGCKGVTVDGLNRQIEFLGKGAFDEKKVSLFMVVFESRLKGLFVYGFGYQDWLAEKCRINEEKEIAEAELKVGTSVSCLLDEI